jgi:hypothetical protein
MYYNGMTWRITYTSRKAEILYTGIRKQNIISSVGKYGNCQYHDGVQGTKGLAYVDHSVMLSVDWVVLRHRD